MMFLLTGSHGWRSAEALGRGTEVARQSRDLWVWCFRGTRTTCPSADEGGARTPTLACPVALCCGRGSLWPQSQNSVSRWQGYHYVALPVHCHSTAVFPFALVAGAGSPLSNEPSDLLSYVGLLPRRKRAGFANGNISF